MYQRPMQVPVEEARRLLKTYRGDDAGMLTSLIRNLGDNVVGTLCVACAGTGILYTLIYNEPV